jgi:hypothetical protein
MDASSHSAAYMIFMIMTATNVIAVTQSPMSLRDTLLMAVAISFLGGVAAAIRQTRDWFILIQFGMNTAVLGASGVMLSHIAIGESYGAQLAAIGIVGILSLGGLSASDWVRSLLQKTIESRLKKHEDEKSDAPK